MTSKEAESKDSSGVVEVASVEETTMKAEPACMLTVVEILLVYVEILLKAAPSIDSFFAAVVVIVVCSPGLAALPGNCWPIWATLPGAPLVADLSNFV